MDSLDALQLQFLRLFEGDRCGISFLACFRSGLQQTSIQSATSRIG
jgi:hypothetical protein